MELREAAAKARVRADRMLRREHDAMSVLTWDDERAAGALRAVVG